MTWPLDPWWSSLTPGEQVALAFVKLDRVGSSRDWSELPNVEAHRRRAQFVAGVEQVAQDFAAVLPLHWQGDGVLLVLPCRDETELLRAWRAARALWERHAIELALPTRIAMHAAGGVAWHPDTGKLAHPAIDLCGHLEQDAPENALAVTEDVALALPDTERPSLGWLGVTKRDGTAAYVFPAASARRRTGERFTDDGPSRLWEAFRQYASGAAIRRVRYAGVRVAPKAPPSLDVLRIFVAPRLALRREIAGWTPITGAEGPPAPGADDGRTGDHEGMRPLARERVVEAAEALQRSRGLVVLGDPGSGKTTLLRWLAAVAAGGKLFLWRATGLAERLLPLPVSVGRLAEIRRAGGGQMSVAEALGRYFEDRSLGTRDELAAFLQSRLVAGDCLVLLDGLDEVASPDRRSVGEWLESFAACAPLCRYIVTSRLAGYAGFVLPQSLEVVVQPFDDAQVERFIREFYRAHLAWDTGTEQPLLADEQARSFASALGSNARLGDVARNPFVLSVLGLLHRAEGRLPRYRVQAYQVLARALCETWGAARRLVAGPARAEMAYEEEALPLLGDLATRIHDTHPSGEAPEEWVLSGLAEALVAQRGVPAGEAGQAAREFLDRAASSVGLLVERSPGRWGFLHLAFQEFFVAASLHAEERFEDEALRRLFDPRWEEVIRLGVGYMALVQGRTGAARQFVARILDRTSEDDADWITSVIEKHIAMATVLAAEVGEALSSQDERRVANRFVDWLLHAPYAPRSRFGQRQLRDLRGTSLARSIGRELARVLQAQPLHSEQVFQIAVALRSQEVVPAMVENLTAGRADDLSDLICALGNLRAHAAVPALSELVRSGVEVYDALFALVQIGTEDALGVLRQALSHGGEEREMAVGALVLGGAENLKADLMEALHDPRANTRLCAAAGLLGHAPDLAIPVLRDSLPPTIRELRSRYLAVDRLSRWSSGTLPLILSALLESRGALRAYLARYVAPSAHVPEVAHALRQLLHDADEDLRLFAARALANVGDPAAIAVLEKVVRESSPWTRIAVAVDLARLGRPAGAECLLELLQDEDPQVRRSAAGGAASARIQAAIPALVAALGREDGAEWVTIDALGELAAWEAVPALVEIHRRSWRVAMKDYARSALWKISESTPTARP